MARKRLQASALGILAAAMLATADPAGAQSSSVYPTDPGGQGTTQVVIVPNGQIVTVTAQSASYSNIDLRVYRQSGGDARRGKGMRPVQPPGPSCQGPGNPDRDEWRGAGADHLRGLHPASRF